MAARLSEHPTADILRVLAVSRSSGALELRGELRGTFFLYEGDVTYAETQGGPAPEPGTMGRRGLADAIREAVLETALLVLTGPAPDTERPLFRPGRGHWTGLTCRLGVETLLAEVTWRVERWTAAGVDPDAAIALRPLPPRRTVVLDPEQWAVVARLGEADTARKLALRTQTSFSAAMSGVAALLAAGACRTSGPPPPQVPVPPAPEAPAVTAPVPPTPPAPVPSALRADVTTATAAIHLPQRTPGATGLPGAPPSRPRPAALGLPEDPADAVRVTHRLLDGLRRMT